MKVFRTRIIIEEPGNFRAEVEMIGGAIFYGWGNSPARAERYALYYKIKNR